MPLPVPPLDDRDFDSLVQEARSLIPRHFPAWTDHNYSDPGIALLELFAHLFETALYQVDRVPEKTLNHFAGLLGVSRGAGDTVEDLFRNVRSVLDSRLRAITGEEMARLALELPADRLPPGERVARVEILPETRRAPDGTVSDSWLSLMIVPEAAKARDSEGPWEPLRPSRALRQAVYQCLRRQSLITTRLRVIEPEYCTPAIDVTVVRGRRSRMEREAVRRTVQSALRDFVDPLRGGEAGRGWPLGRPIYRSELYYVIEGLPGVDHVRRLELLGILPLPPSPAAPETRAALPLPSPRHLMAWNPDTCVVHVTDL